MNGNRDVIDRQEDDQLSIPNQILSTDRATFAPTEQRWIVSPAKCAVGAVAGLGLAMAVMLGAWGWKLHIAVQKQRELAELGIEYKLEAPLGRKTTLASRSFPMKHWLSRLVPEGISEVRIREGDLGDQHLQVLGSLDKVQVLELQSDLATDETLKTISRMNNLNTLKVDGKQFSIFGLLQLRDSRLLRVLCVDTDRLSPIEMAVLRAELPQVKIFNSAESAPHSIQFDLAPADLPPMRLKAFIAA